MNKDKIQFYYSMLYEFRFERDVTEAHQNLCSVFGPSKVEVRTVQKWFLLFLL